MSYAVHHHLGSDSAWPAADKCVRVCVQYSNTSGEGSGSVSIVTGPIPGERSVQTLACCPPPRCCVVIVNSDADFEMVFFFFYSFLFSVFVHRHCRQIQTILVQLRVSSWNTASVVKQREGAREDGRGPCYICQFPYSHH